MGTLMRAASTRLMNEPPGGSIRARSTVSVYLCSYLSDVALGPLLDYTVEESYTCSVHVRDCPHLPLLVTRSPGVRRTSALKR